MQSSHKVSTCLPAPAKIHETTAEKASILQPMDSLWLLPTTGGLILVFPESAGEYHVPAFIVLAYHALHVTLQRMVCPAGAKAALIADYAARLHIPVVRFISKGAAVGASAPHPLYERPAALVFATEEDEHAFDIDQMAEALRLVISPAK